MLFSWVPSFKSEILIWKANKTILKEKKLGKVGEYELLSEKCNIGSGWARLASKIRWIRLFFLCLSLLTVLFTLFNFSHNKTASFCFYRLLNSGQCFCFIALRVRLNVIHSEFAAIFRHFDFDHVFLNGLFFCFLSDFLTLMNIFFFFF